MTEPHTQEEALMAVNDRLSKRLNDVAALEARSALVNGPAAQGALVGEKQRLIKQLDTILDKLEALYAQRP